MKNKLNLNQTGKFVKICPNDEMNFKARHLHIMFCSKRCVEEYHNARKINLKPIAS